MPLLEAPPRPWMPRGVAYLLSLLVVPLAMGAMYFTAFEVDSYVAKYGPSKTYVWLCILLPAGILNSILALLSIPQKQVLRFVPRFVTLLVFSALGLVLYVVLMLVTARGGLKPGG